MSTTVSRIQDLHVPIVVVGPDGLVGYANPAAHRMLAYAPGALVGMPLYQLTSEASWYELSQEPVLHRQSSMGRLQSQALRSDGRTVDVNMTIEPATTEGNAFVVSYEVLPPWKVKKAV
jgi:PAS domain S-box-containing protein